MSLNRNNIRVFRLMVRPLIVLLGLIIICACKPSVLEPPKEDTRPIRIVSLDYCADQYVLKLVDRERILAVSPDAHKSFSYMRSAASGLNTVRPLAEDVLLLQPDLVVRSYGGGPGATAFFESAGIPVLNVGWVNTLGDIKKVAQAMADGLGESERGQKLVEEFDNRLAAIDSAKTHQTALYMTPFGATTGPGSLIHEMLVAAGFENFQTKPGWRELPLERLAYEQPDKVAAAFFDHKENHMSAWSSMRHPIARNQMRDRPTVKLQGAWTSCGSWFLIEAIEALAVNQDVSRITIEPVTEPRIEPGFEIVIREKPRLQSNG